MSRFQQEIQSTINRYAQENSSGTPDNVLAQFLTEVLASFNRAVASREHHYGRNPNPGILGHGALGTSSESQKGSGQLGAVLPSEQAESSNS